MENKKSLFGNTCDYFLVVLSHIVLAISVTIVLIAIFDRNNSGEASIGSFDAIEYGEGWTLTTENGVSEIDLPFQFDAYKGQTVSISKTLPDNMSDNMSFMLRASMEDIYIYIDGELREEYSADGIDFLSFYVPSAYVVAKLNSADSGKEIRIDICTKSIGLINSTSLGYGNDVWFSVLKRSMPVNLAAIIVLILGLILVVGVAITKNYITDNKALRYLAFLMINIALWLISESTIRQFIFSRPSLSEIFAYTTVELMGAYACMYFDEVQHKKHHKIYRIVECVVLAQLFVNLSLSFLKVAELYATLLYSHIWTAIAIVIAITCIVKDVVHGEIKKYKATAIGMICFLLTAIIELAGFYLTRFYVFGTFVCFGLVLLMTFTIIQALLDVINTSKDREYNQLQMMNNTIETIASSIDAKDEYTGGHSERVGLYAERLAREIAADYGFSEDDILRIRYIGLVHDIGKIGVSDSVLNKAGRLTDEEFSLMKKHTEIGYEIMGATGESMEGLLDGIRYHHERFDGKGYPKGLAYTDIPLVARILALADSYDAMTSNRVYRKRLTDEEVRNELLRCSGTQFDPALTEAFVRLIDRGELRVNTEDGMAIDSEGNIPISAKLENRLQSDLLEKTVNVKHPTHVRMMCYVIKLMEKKKKKISVFFYGPDIDKYGSEEELSIAWDELNSAAKEYMSGQDMIIRYSDEFNVIALFDKEESEINDFAEKISSTIGEKSLKNLVFSRME